MTDLESSCKQSVYIKRKITLELGNHGSLVPRELNLPLLKGIVDSVGGSFEAH